MKKHAHENWWGYDEVHEALKDKRKKAIVVCSKLTHGSIRRPGDWVWLGLLDFMNSFIDERNHCKEEYNGSIVNYATGRVGLFLVGMQIDQPGCLLSQGAEREWEIMVDRS